MEHDRSDELLSRGWSRGFAGSFWFSDIPDGSGATAWFLIFGYVPIFPKTLFFFVVGRMTDWLTRNVESRLNLLSILNLCYFIFVFGRMAD